MQRKGTMRLRSQNSIREEDQNGRLLQSQNTLNKNSQAIDIKKITAEVNAIEKMHGKADIIDNSISNPEACDK